MSTIQLHTPIPGPKSNGPSERRAKAVPRGLSRRHAHLCRQSRRRLARRRDGNRYIDFAGGIGCAPTLDIAEPAVVRGCEGGQLDHFLHMCVQVTPYESYVRLAEVHERTDAGKVREENHLRQQRRRGRRETRSKIARAYTKRPGIIAFEDAFHGRTMMTLALTSKTHPYKAGFAPFPSGVYASRLRIVIAAPTT